MTAFVTQAQITAFRRGMADGIARFGLLLEGFEPAILHGFFYYQHVPRTVPPRWLLALVTRLSPRIRRKIATSKRAFEDRIWRDDLRWWDDELKPAAIRAHLALQQIDPSGLELADLAHHLVACRDHYERMVYQHHRFTATCALPVGDFLASMTAWTGKPAGELLQLLRGSTPISLGVAAAELDALGAAVRGDPESQQRLASEGPARETLRALEVAPGGVGAATAAYLAVVGYRSLGYDVADGYALELPDMLVRAIRVAAEGNARAEAPEAQRARVERVREAVPREHRAELDELVAETRSINRLRDERGVYSDMWAAGLARRALLAAGAQLASRGRLANAELAIDAACEEVVAMLRDAGGPPSEELERRARWRTTRTVADVPRWLGSPPRPPPPAEWLPPDARRAARAVTYFMSSLLLDADAPSSGHRVAGLPASPGIYEGTARRALGREDFGKLQKGDVLIAQSTSPSFNVVLPLLGAIVTDRGGQLCHAAIVAREYGIPCVVGTRDATRVIEDGCRVRVDGERGVVEVLAVSSSAAEDGG
jgi:pyruvate,water dikinase